jgi:uncharacterized protein
VTGAVPRDPRLDALRGFALAGILLVNIQSFLSGSINAIGFLPAEAGLADRTAYLFTATLVVGKFMPLFGMLFGTSFALFYDKLRSTVGNPRVVYRRRLQFLLVFGVLHGLFVYFGDITHVYAIAGFVLLWHADGDVDAIERATLRWWMFAAVWMVLLIVPLTGTPAVVTSENLEEVYLNVAASTMLGYWDQWTLRAHLFGWQVQANLAGLPTVIALMMTGVLAQRAGWLRNPGAPAWDRAAHIGLGLGLPAAVAYGAWSVTHSEIADSLAMPATMVGALTASLTLSFFYAAVFIRRAPQFVIDWVAPAGRMALTNYLLQSVAMGVLLSGWGLGLGAKFSYWHLSALAVSIFILQAVASRWWLARFAQGPLEAVWRAWTYRGAERLPPAV